MFSNGFFSVNPLCGLCHFLKTNLRPFTEKVQKHRGKIIVNFLQNETPSHFFWDPKFTFYPNPKGVFPFVKLS